MSPRKKLVGLRNPNVAEQKRIRRNGGATLIFAVVLVVVFTAIAVPALGYLANLTEQTVIRTDALHIANQAAQVLDDQQYWLDVIRPDLENFQERAMGAAREAAAQMCLSKGMKLDHIDFVCESPSVDSDGHTLVKLWVDAGNRYPLRMPLGFFDMNHYFPSQIYVEANIKHLYKTPYAMVHLGAPSVQKSCREIGYRDVAVLPAYGFFYSAAGGPGPGYGDGLSEGMDPENVMSMNHYHLKNVDVTHALAGNQVRLSSWNSIAKVGGTELEGGIKKTSSP